MLWEFLAEGSFVVSIFAVPSSVAHQVVGNTSSVQAHEAACAAQVGGFSRCLRGTEFGFVLPSWAMVDTIANSGFHNADSSGASELTSFAFGFFLFWQREGLAVLTFIFAVGAVPSSVAQLNKRYTSSVRA